MGYTFELLVLNPCTFPLYKNGFVCSVLSSPRTWEDSWHSVPSMLAGGNIAAPQIVKRKILCAGQERAENSLEGVHILYASQRCRGKGEASCWIVNFESLKETQSLLHCRFQDYCLNFLHWVILNEEVRILAGGHGVFQLDFLNICI